MIEKEMLLKVAEKKGLKNKEHIEKDYLQDLFLFNLYQRTNVLVFKGGTALYKLYGLPRFSEDLDFSILKKIKIEPIIRKAAEGMGGQLKDIKKTKHYIAAKIAFEGVLTRHNTLRIDINTRNVVFDYEVRHYVPAYITINPFSLRVLELREIVAEKVHSLLHRAKARDLYDLFFLLRFVKPDRKIIERKLAVFNMKFDYNEFERRVQKLEMVWHKELAPFMLTELTEFSVVKDFVLNALKHC